MFTCLNMTLKTIVPLTPVRGKREPEVKIGVLVMEG